MDVSEDSLSARRGAFDGQKFFSRSPFRSAYFLVITALCASGTIFGLSILYRYRVLLSTEGMAGFLIFVCGFLFPWWRVLRYHELVRQLYSEGSVTNVEPGSALDVALGVAAGVIVNSLFYAFATMLALLAYIEHLLKRCP
jgi:hypothetical protein